LVQLMI